MNAMVNADTCIGCELCVNECGDVFKMQDGKAVGGAVPAGKEDAAKSTAGNCPVSCIEIK